MSLATRMFKHPISFLPFMAQLTALKSCGWCSQEWHGSPQEMLHQKRKKLIWRNFQLLLSQRKNPRSLVSCACDSGYCESEFQHISQSRTKDHKRLVWKSKIRFLISILVFGLLPDTKQFWEFNNLEQGTKEVINCPKNALKASKVSLMHIAYSSTIDTSRLLTEFECKLIYD